MFITYIILTIFIGIFHILYKGDLSFIILAFLFALPVVMFIILAIQVRLLRISVSSDNSVSERGKAALIRIIFHNRSILPIAACKISVKYRSVYMSDIPSKRSDEKYTITIPVKQRTVETVSLSLTPDHCGVVEFYIKNIKITDFLCFSFLFRKIGFADKIIVLPNAFPMNGSLENGIVNGSESNIFSTVKAGDDPSEIFQLREYRDGDRHNRIHWKLSSRSESFIVKELSQPVNSKILILCDFSGCGDAGQTDMIFDMAMTLSSFFIRNGTVHTLAAAFDDCTLFTADISNDNELYAAFTGLCTNIGKLDRSHGIAEISSIADNTMMIRNGFSHVLAVTGTINKAVAGELSRLCGEARLTIFCTSPEKISENTGEDIGEEVIYSSAEKLEENNFGFDL
ncbi:MAG: DUF58 domain-containing protein [Oscillospiraceae bacterium]|nr:DUF58 domain-containing protein [Oscillospiraceae bacterium]